MAWYLQKAKTGHAHVQGQPVELHNDKYAHDRDNADDYDDAICFPSIFFGWNRLWGIIVTLKN